MEVAASVLIIAGSIAVFFFLCWLISEYPRQPHQPDEQDALSALLPHPQTALQAAMQDAVDGKSSGTVCIGYDNAGNSVAAGIADCSSGADISISGGAMACSPQAREIKLPGVTSGQQEAMGKHITAAKQEYQSLSSRVAVFLAEIRQQAVQSAREKVLTSWLRQQLLMELAREELGLAEQETDLVLSDPVRLCYEERAVERFLKHVGDRAVEMAEERAAKAVELDLNKALRTVWGIGDC